MFGMICEHFQGSKVSFQLEFTDKKKRLDIQNADWVLKNRTINISFPLY